FRLKIVDGSKGTGQILGSAERLRPAGADDDSGRRSIFPILEQHLGDEVWRVILSDAGPVLALNYRIPGFKHRILENPLVQGIILPAAFRIVLERLIADPVADDEDEDDWRTLWLRFLKERLSIDDDPSEIRVEDREDWIDAAVQKFCHTHGFVE